MWVGATAVYALSLFAVSRTLATRFGNESLSQVETAVPPSDDPAAEEGAADSLQSADTEAPGPPVTDRRTRARKGLGSLPRLRGVWVIVVLASLGAGLIASGSLGTMAMRERMMKELARRGWLWRRYRAAVDAYRRRRAIETGEDPAAVLRPDHDPREVRTVRSELRRQVSGRWRFMHDLLEGTYDRDLSRALATSDYAHAAEWAFHREGTLEASDVGGSRSIDTWEP